jgi:hypothetical protein
MSDDNSWMIQHQMNWAKETPAQRRERIATAVLAGLVTDMQTYYRWVQEGLVTMDSKDYWTECAWRAVKHADALIAELDRK